jgi:hypothetical protein
VAYKRQDHKGEAAPVELTSLQHVLQMPNVESGTTLWFQSLVMFLHSMTSFLPLEMRIYILCHCALDVCNLFILYLQGLIANCLP